MLKIILIVSLLGYFQLAMATESPSTRSAQTMWMLNCQGCHRPDGSGIGSAVPPMPGIVARFLIVPGWREYLIRVPGVAASPLPDDSLAVLVNWMLEEFDPENIPDDFTPYTTEEVASLRKLGAYGGEAATIRTSLMQSYATVITADP